MEGVGLSEGWRSGKPRTWGPARRALDPNGVMVLPLQSLSFLVCKGGNDDHLIIIAGAQMTQVVGGRSQVEVKCLPSSLAA